MRLIKVGKYITINMDHVSHFETEDDRSVTVYMNYWDHLEGEPFKFLFDIEDSEAFLLAVDLMQLNGDRA
jgi:hypothetical protein